MVLRRLVLLGLSAVAFSLLMLGRDEAATGEPGARDVAAEGYAVATFAGGCFWCVEPPFDALPGVRSTTSGYTGGQLPNPTYEQVSAGGTGHAEAVRVEYDPRQVSYGQLLDVFWRNIDPFAVDSQFCDHGNQYRSAIFAHDEEQRRLAQASLDVLARSGRFSQPIQTRLEPAAPFYPAEDYHQDYALKNPVRYKYYRFMCGRDRRLAEVWGADAPTAHAAAPLAESDPAGTGMAAGAADGAKPDAGSEAADVEPASPGQAAGGGDEPALLRDLLEKLSDEGLSDEERELLQDLIEQESSLDEHGDGPPPPPMQR